MPWPSAVCPPPHPFLSLAAVLAADGHLVTLEKMEDWNVVELKVNEEVVFHCNIKDLEFGNLPTPHPPPSPHAPQHGFLSSALSFQLKGSVCVPRSSPGFFPSRTLFLKAPCPVALNERILNHIQGSAWCSGLLPRTLGTERQKENEVLALGFKYTMGI